MKAEKQVTSWEDVEVEKCGFCGDVYEEGKLELVFFPGDRETKYCCEFCKDRDPEPRYPDGMREKSN